MESDSVISNVLASSRKSIRRLRSYNSCALAFAEARTFSISGLTCICEGQKCIQRERNSNVCMRRYEKLNRFRNR